MNRDQIDALQRLLPACLRQDRREIESRLRRLQQAGFCESAATPKLERLLAQAQRSAAIVRHRLADRPPIRYPPELPITARKDDIVAAIQSHPVVVIAGETGSGKSTQIPKMCLAAGLGATGRIGCTQPRRLAALSISRRLARELNVSWGGEVGCKIRFSDRSSPETVIKFMTDGVLLAEIQGDPELAEYDAIIIDEAHERSLNIDFLLGHLKTLLSRRTDLKLIITSATIDTQAFSKAFDHAPVLEVSGRLYPVEIRYAPHDPEAEESGELTYIDAAVNAAETLLTESDRGDILLFMPGERDIRETVDGLGPKHGKRVEILPLFGRLSASDQERVFAAGPKRKIIVATNIAETSLTIPGIHYVIDPGLARISRYNPRTRTKRLPIEEISQSSANQRAGRSGRVENGVCVRLYSEADFTARPRFTQPEIQRANLAEVILRLKAFRLGEIESFPFLNPPSSAAIQNGYQLLQELGALDRERNLTALGRDLARLPVDPSIGRMVLQSTQENALEEVLIIAAGLSSQDPRERPLDRQGAADQAHRRFLDPRSDFLTLLNIWEAFHDTWETLRTQNQLRKFCRANFLSYLRMREWRDIHAQLRESLAEVMIPGRAQPASASARPGARYAAIHRSILTGLLSHVARRCARNLYRGAGQRELMIFPGSSLFEQRTQDRHALQRDRQDTKEVEPCHSTQPEWIMAGEILETSRLYARTVAKIHPAWIVDLGAHLCQRQYSDPHWDRQAGCVLAREHISMFGLPVRDRQVNYGRINPDEATAIFIRSALVEEDIDLSHRFLERNHRVRQRVEAWRTQSRTGRLPDPDQALFNFYAQRLHRVTSTHDLDRFVLPRLSRDPGFLCACESDLTGGQALDWDESAFPQQARLAGQAVSLEYAYAPGEPQDGVTVRVPAALVHQVQPPMLDWLIPGLREEQIAFLLKALPKSLRVALMPAAAKVKELAAALQPDDGLDQLRRLIHEKYRIAIPTRLWVREMLPDHLRVRVSIIGPDHRPVACGRDLDALKRGLEHRPSRAEHRAWTQAVECWERYDLQGWTFADPPDRIALGVPEAGPLYAFPGLAIEAEAVHLRLFPSREEAEQASVAGWMRLAEVSLRKELAWLRKDLKTLTSARGPSEAAGPFEDLTATAYTHLRQYLLRPPSPVLPLRKAVFDQGLAHAKSALPGLGPRFAAQVRSILDLRQEIVLCKKPYAAMRGDLEVLVSPRFLETTPFERLAHLPRYLKAMLVRAERAWVNPAKDQEKARRAQPYVEALRKWSSAELVRPGALQAFAAFRWMVEEFKVSIFAQELGTAQPVSAQRLNTLLQTLEWEHNS